MSWRLIALTDPYKNQAIEVKQDLIVGSDPNVQLVLEDMGLSRRHAALLLRDDELWVYDLNSVAGTLINGQPVIEEQLYTDDVVSLGEMSFRLAFGELGETPTVNTERTVYQERLAKLRERDQYTQQALRNTAMAQQKSRFAMTTAPVSTKQPSAEADLDVALLNKQHAELTSDQDQYHADDESFDYEGVPIDRSDEVQNEVELEDIANSDQYDTDALYQAAIERHEVESLYQDEEHFAVDSEVDQLSQEKSSVQSADEIADIDRESYEAYLAEYYRELEQQPLAEQADDLAVDIVEERLNQKNELLGGQISTSNHNSPVQSERGQRNKKPMNARNQPITQPTAANDDTGYMDENRFFRDEEAERIEGHNSRHRQSKIEIDRDDFSEMPPVSSTYRAPLKSPTVRPMPSRFDVEKPVQPQKIRQIHAGEQPRKTLSQRPNQTDAMPANKMPHLRRDQPQKKQSIRRAPTSHPSVSPTDRHASHLASLLEDRPLADDSVAIQSTRVRSTLQKTSQGAMYASSNKSEESLQSLVETMAKRQAASLRPMKTKMNSSDMTVKKRPPHQAKTAIKGVVSVLVLIALVVVICWLLLVYGYGS